MAERVGFEPTVELPLHSISNAAPSTARSPLLKTVKPGEMERSSAYIGGLTRPKCGRLCPPLRSGRLEPTLELPLHPAPAGQFDRLFTP